MNKLLISAAGSGKTTYLVNQALSKFPESVLITTYTEANETEIKKKIIKKEGCIPSNITIQTWFKFLLKNGVRPFQSTMHEDLHEKNIGFFLTNQKSGYRYGNVYWGEKDFFKYYFTDNLKIYSDKISKFVCNCNDKTKNDIIFRICKIYKNIFIDEVQDLAGFDLEVIKLLFKSSSSVLLVGDPRQVTYLTHPTIKYKKYSNGKINDFLKNELGNDVEFEIDEETLNDSHRNNQLICSYSAKLFPDLPIPNACKCTSCRGRIQEHEGVYLIKPTEVEDYLRLYEPIQLRWNARKKCSSNYPVFNLGESKGMTFDRVIIYPTSEMEKWIKDNSYTLKDESCAKFYVGLTRARYSSTIVMDYKDEDSFCGIEKYSLVG